MSEPNLEELNQKIKTLESLFANEQKKSNRLIQTIKTLTARNGYLLVLNDLTAGLMDRTNLEELLEKIVRHACILAKTDHGFMHLRDIATDELIFKIGIGEFKKAVGVIVQPGTGMADVALTDKKAFWVEDYSQWENRLANPIFNTLRACVVLPLKNKFGTIGLGRFGNDNRLFTNTEIAILERFSNMASICIQNASLYQELETQLAHRKKVEKRLKISEAEFFSIFDSIQVGFFRTSLEGDLVLANHAAVEMMGYDSQEDWAGTPIHTMYKNIKDRDILMQRLLKEGQVSAYEVEMVKKDQQPITVLVNAHFRKNDLGTIEGLQGTIVDITHHKQQAVEILHSQKLEAIGSLAAGIAHEINTPIQYVADNTSFLEEAFDDLDQTIKAAINMHQAMENQAELKKYAQGFETKIQDLDLEYLHTEIPLAIAQSLDGLSKVSRIVKSMKEFSYSKGDSWELSDINHIIETTLIVAENQWKSVADIRKRLQKNLPRVPCNQSEIGQVLLNMIINAADAIRERFKSGKGQIKIQTIEYDTRIEIQITDNGAGIAPGIRKQIFNPFFTTKKTGRRSGQGLSIAHSIIVKRHKGKILFESDMGKGTGFVIQLPRV